MKKNECNRITTVEKTDEQYHRAHIIIHDFSMFHIADFKDQNQLDFFANMLGFTYELEKEENSHMFGIYRQFRMSHRLNSPCCGGFWSVEDLPIDAKPFKALSNGSIVTCYFTNDGQTINIIRPNPNAKEVYIPLALQEHINHVKEYGLY